jgi:hypothetical protein
MNLINSPKPLPAHDKPFVFAGGSIEMGLARNWQFELYDRLIHQDAYLLNPRRRDWDPSWEQRIEHEKFNEQVSWELSALEASDIKVFYFDPSTKAPVTLLELGLFGQTGMSIVCCPEGYWRKGNVDIVCQRYGIALVESFEEMVERLDKLLTSLSA